MELANKPEKTAQQTEPKPGSWSIVYQGFVRRLRYLVVGLHLATLIACFANFHWVADLFAHFRVQYCLLLLASSVMLVVFSSWRLLLVSLVCLMINLFWMAPYAVGLRSSRSVSNVPVAQSEQATYRILTLNVLTHNKQYQSVIDQIDEANPDFVVLMEVNSRWESQLRDSVLSERYPFARYVPRDYGNFGIAFLSKTLWSDLEVVYVQPLELASMVIDLPLPLAESSDQEIQSLQIVATHPIPPISEYQTNARDTQLMDMAGRVQRDAAALMVGDFNLTPWSPRFTKILEKSQMSDSAIGQGIRPTWYVFPSLLGGLKIDHVLINDHVRVVEHDILRDVGSDHRGVLVDFQLINSRH